MTMPPDTEDVPESPDTGPQPVPSKRTRFVVAALAICALGLVALAIGLTVTAGGEDAPAAEAADAEGGRALALAESDCFTAFRQDGTKIFARAVPCTGPHEGEVHAKPALPILDYPGDERLVSEGRKACRVQASSLYAAGRDDEFTLFVGRPDKKEWERGDRAVTCLLRYTGGPKNFRLEGQWTSRSYLAEGDCVGTWKDTAEVDVVDCTRKHDVQVLAKIEMADAEEPDEATANVLCARRARRIFGSEAPAHLLLRLGGPNKREWAGGDRYILCLAAAEKGRLTGSVLPG